MKAKVCIVGPQGVGKSLIASRFDGSTISPQIRNAKTMFANCNVLIGEKTVDLEMSEVSGEEKLRCMGPIFYKEAKAALFVFDLTSEKTFEALNLWVKSVRNDASDECVLIIIGNKIDLDTRQVSLTRGLKYAKSVGAKYFEVSAVSGKGLLNVVVYLAKHLLRWNDCKLSYAAKRSITSNFIEYIVPQDDQKKKKEVSLVMKRLL